MTQSYKKYLTYQKNSIKLVKPHTYKAGSPAEESIKISKREEGMFMKKTFLIFSVLVVSLFFIGDLLLESSYAQTKPTEVKAKPKPKVAQKLIIAQGTDALTMDTHHGLDAPTFTILDHMVEPLLELTPKGEIAPKLAEKWEVSPDATEFVLKLRKGVKFHDGTPVKAEAVKVNFDRRLDPKAATKYGFLVAPISSVTVVDEYTVKIKTKAPFAALISNLTHQANGIQSPESLKASWDKPVTKPVGTGPFMYKEWVPGNKFVMVRNDHYWGKKPRASSRRRARRGGTCPVPADDAQAAAARPGRR